MKTALTRHDTASLCRCRTKIHATSGLPGFPGSSIPWPVDAPRKIGQSRHTETSSRDGNRFPPPLFLGSKNSAEILHSPPCTQRSDMRAEDRGRTSCHRGETGFTAELGRRHADLSKLLPASVPQRLAGRQFSREQVLHYVAQDYQYLTAYTRCYGLGWRLPDRRWMRFFHDNAAVILCAETHAHESLCAYVKCPERRRTIWRPAQAYINHMMEAGGTLSACCCPLCCRARGPVGGGPVHQRNPPDPSHPFYGWWDFTRACTSPRSSPKPGPC